MPDDYTGVAIRECGEHRTTGARAWCFDCREWCYPDPPCARCEVPMLRGQERCIAAALADLDQVPPPDTATAAFHPARCWLYHAECLAARIRRHLTGEDPDHA